MFLNFGVGLVNPKPQGEKNMQEGTINVPIQYVSLNIQFPIITLTKQLQDDMV